MKLRKRILSFILSVSMLGMFAPNILAEDTTGETTPEETVTDTFEVTINPENYASICISQDGYHDSGRALEVYYNTFYPTNDNLLAEHCSIIASYAIPFKNALSATSISYYVIKGGMESGRTIPVFYDLNKFEINAEAGGYAKFLTDGETVNPTYQAVLDYTANYWPASGYSYSGRPFAGQLAHSILETSTGTKTYDVTAKVLDNFLASESDYITFATGRETSKYANGSFRTNTEERLPKMTLVYSKSALLEIINTSEKADLPELLSDLNTVGVLSSTTAGYTGYSELVSAAKAYVNDELAKSVANGGFETIEDFYAAYDEVVSTVKELTQEDNIISKISPDNYAVIHIMDEGYHGHSRAERVYYNTPYSENTSLYVENGSIITSFKVSLKNMISSMAIDYTINGAGQMHNGHVPVFYDINKFEIDAPAGVYDMVVEDTTTEGDATTEEGTTEEGTTEEGTTDGSDDSLEEDEEPGGSVDIPTEETTKDVYAEVLNYTSNYWPANGSYSYSATNFSSKVAYKITSSSTGRLSHDITNTALKALLTDEEAEYVTLSTGRETSGYIDFRMNVSTESRIPTLSLVYSATDLVDYVNSVNSAEELDEIIKNIGEAGILSNTVNGFGGYTGVGEKYKAQIREALYEQIESGGYLKFADFLDLYDSTILYVLNNVINNPDVYINFNDETANDVSGNNKNGEIVGDVTFTEGPDGSKALKIANTFGKTAEQYLNMGEYDLSADSFSFVFWMKAPGRGIKYEESGDSITAGTPVDFSTYTGTSGGVVLSNKDFSVNDNTGFAFAAMPIYADFSFNMKLGDNSASNTVGIQTAIDSRWHQISFVVNRQGKASFYVDNTLTKEIDISKIEGTLGVSDVVFGADGLGQYGMNKGEFDDIKFYSSALEANKIEELYYKSALNNVNNEIETLLESDDVKYYSEDDIDELTEKLAESKTFVAGYEAGNTASMIAHFDELDAYFNNFLGKGANSIAAWGSDVHISEDKETHLNAQNLKRFLTESAEFENPADTFIISGDLADVGADDLRYFFKYVGNWSVEGANMVICRGNHDEPVGSEKDTGISRSREELKNMYVNWMNEYVDKTLPLNADVIDSEGNLNQPFYYATDGAAHYLSVDIYWPTARSISDTQLAWLKKVLDTISGDGKPIFFVMHNPLYGTQPRVESDKNQLSKTADTKIKNLVKDYDNIFILTGHHHEGLGSGDGDPFKVKLDDGTETGVWLINTTVLCSKNISRGYEWAGGYYINVYDDKVVFRGRDFENQKWLREYDMTFALTPAKEETAMGEIKLVNLDDNSEYVNIADAVGKTVKVQIPVTFADETAESFATILSFYNGETLLGAKIGEVSVNDEYIEYETEIPSDATEIKVMCWETVGNMIPVCDAVSK